MDYSRWMTVLETKIGSMALNRLVIPGSHDSGSFGISQDSALTPGAPSLYQAAVALPGLPSAVAKTQSKDIACQFISGIRYFDLRIIERSPDNFWLHHSFYSVPLLPELQKLGRLLRQPMYYKEIVILDVRVEPGDRDVTPDVLESLVNFLWDNLGSCICSRRDFPELSATSTLQDFWKANRNVILLYGSPERHFLSQSRYIFWDRDVALQSNWLNKPSVEELVDAFKLELKTGRPDNKLWVAQGVVTLQTLGVIADAVESLFKGVSGLLGWNAAEVFSLQSYAQSLNPQIIKLLQDDPSGSISANRPNILIADFVECGNFTEECVNLNVR